MLVRFEGSILAANSQACRILGASEDELLRWDPGGLVDWRNPKAQRVHDACHESGQFRGELTGPRVDGPPFPVKFSVTAFQGGDQRMQVVIFRDLTERKRAEAERRWYAAELQQRNQELRLLPQQMAEGVVGVDEQGQILQINRAARSMFGPSRAAEGQSVQGTALPRTFTEALRRVCSVTREPERLDTGQVRVNP